MIYVNGDSVTGSCQLTADQGDPVGVEQSVRDNTALKRDMMNKRLPTSNTVFISTFCTDGSRCSWPFAGRNKLQKAEEFKTT
jgi:hypothetical protein